jgi:polysaccharide deacetylase 2 family uncharacterized protein YibQ
MALPVAAGMTVGLVLLGVLMGPASEPVGRASIERRPAAALVTLPKPAVEEKSRPAEVTQPPSIETPRAAAPAEPAWRRFAVAVPSTTLPQIAIIIDDMGIDRRLGRAMAALPGPLTLSFLPYAPDLPAQTQAARTAGHELMVHIPMEPDHPEASVPASVLSVDLSPGEAIRRLYWALGRFDGFVGVNNHMGSRFTADADHMRPVLEELKRRGLLFVDSRTSPRTVGPSIARGLGLPFVGRDVFLDHEDDSAAIRARLRDAEGIARRQGYAVAIGHPRERTLAALKEWLPTVAERGLVLVPISAIVYRLTRV